MRLVSTCLSVIVLAVLFHGHPSVARTLVDVELVLAVDVSQSVDVGEHELQREGYVAALRHPAVVTASRMGLHGRAAITYVEWGGPASQSVILPWTLVEDRDSASAMAAALAAPPVRTIRGTSISSALTFAADLLDSNEFEGFRRIIDVSGDGPNSSGVPVVPTRDALVVQGIIINGLPIMIRMPSFTPWSIPDLDIYYADCVIGGPGSFVLPVDDPDRLAELIRQKLVLEIAGVAARPIPAASTSRPSRIDCLIGEKLRQQWYEYDR